MEFQHLFVECLTFHQVLEVFHVKSSLKLQLERIENFQIPPTIKWWRWKNLNFKEMLVFPFRNSCKVRGSLISKKKTTSHSFLWETFLQKIKFLKNWKIILHLERITVSFKYFNVKLLDVRKLVLYFKEMPISPSIQEHIGLKKKKKKKLFNSQTTLLAKVTTSLPSKRASYFFPKIELLPSRFTFDAWQQTRPLASHFETQFQQ